MTFPDKKYSGSDSYVDAYFSQIGEAAASVDRARVADAVAILTKAFSEGRMVYSCGNGGSAAIANHLACDHCKLVRTDTDLSPKIFSLSTTVEVITAIGNDMSYDEIFAYQLDALAEADDVLITISSSGDSENVVRAIQVARDKGMPVISMSGFSGGRSAQMADVSLHETADNYGVIEDVHQSLMHLLAQYIRHAHMDETVIRERKF